MSSIFALGNNSLLPLTIEQMKKYILLLSVILLLIFSFNATAQRRNSVWLSGTAGMNSNWILNQNAYGNQEMEYATSFNPSGGIGLMYFKNREWGFSGSAYISKLGQNYSGYQGGGEAKRKVKLAYVEVPFMLMKQIPDMNYPTWISAGPSVMLLLKGNQDYSRDGGSPLPFPDGMNAGDISERFKPVDVALNFSINRMMELNYSRSMMFLFSVNSSLGLLDINRTDYQIENTHHLYAPSHNFYIGFKVGLMLKVGMMGGRRW